MSERKKFFFSGDDKAEIFLHPDGSLTVEIETDYGDSETGWGVTFGTAYLDADQVDRFRRFLARETE